MHLSDVWLIVTATVIVIVIVDIKKILFVDVLVYLNVTRKWYGMAGRRRVVVWWG